MSEKPDARDPLGRDVQLDHRVVIPVLGIPVSFESNDPAVIAIAEEAFGAWRIVEQAPRLIADERVRFRIYVDDEGDEGPSTHAPLRHRIPDYERIILQSRGSVGLGDSARREAVLYTTRALVQDRQHFRYGALEALTLGVLTKLDRQPLHAACIAQHDAALLLAGPSGVGKSTLAYVAGRKGLRVLAEDYVNIQLDPRLRIWGTPGWIHLPLDARERFPELAGRHTTLRANGKEKIAISLAEMESPVGIPVAQRAGICVLVPSEEASLETLDAAALEEAMTGQLDPGFDEFVDTIGRAIRLLAGHGGWRLHTGRDPRLALEKLTPAFDLLTAD